MEALNKQICVIETYRQTNQRFLKDKTSLGIVHHKLNISPVYVAQFISSQFLV